MRSVLFTAILCLFVLTACSSAPAPTATPVPPTAAPPTNPPANVSDSALSTLAATVGVPNPGTLVIPTQALTPNAPPEVPLAINQLTFTQTGGIAGISLNIQLHGDGTLIRDGVTSKVSADAVQGIADQLEKIRFFDLQGIFTGAGASADTYHYTLTVDSAGRNRTITSQDGMTPPELTQLYGSITNLGNS